MGRLSVAIGWKSTVLTALVVPLCLSLGMWQLQRADEKEAIAAMYATRINMVAMPLNSIEAYEDKTHLPVVVNGQYSGQHLLLENQWRQKKLGVEVLSVFETSDGQWLLINRGWIANKDRSITPTFTTPDGQQTLWTTVYQPSKAPYSLGELMIDPSAAVQRLSYLDIEQIRSALQKPLYPLSLRLSANNTDGFDTHWPEINVKPETHVGYAVQWFLFAALAVIVFIFANSNLGSLIRKREK